MILHRKNQFLDSSTSTSLTLDTSQYARTKVTYQQFNALPTTDWTGKVTGVKGNRTCSDKINYDQCVYQAKERMMIEQTKEGCTVPFTPNNAKVCNESDDIIAAFVISKKPLEKHHCPIPCQNLITNFGGKTSMDFPIHARDPYNAKLYFGTRVQKIEERQLYKFINLVAESGSIAKNSNLLRNESKYQN